jgi:hypothetical protein
VSAHIATTDIQLQEALGAIALTPTGLALIQTFSLSNPVTILWGGAPDIDQASTQPVKNQNNEVVGTIINVNLSDGFDNKTTVGNLITGLAHELLHAYDYNMGIDPKSYIGEIAAGYSGESGSPVDANVVASTLRNLGIGNSPSGMPNDVSTSEVRAYITGLTITLELASLAADNSVENFYEGPEYWRPNYDGYASFSDTLVVLKNLAKNQFISQDPYLNQLLTRVLAESK